MDIFVSREYLKIMERGLIKMADVVPKGQRLNPPTVQNNRGCMIMYEAPLPNAVAVETINKMTVDQLPEELQQEISQYAMDLRKKHPAISIQTVTKRICTKFNINLVS